jgi:hypothetical protein
MGLYRLDTRALVQEIDQELRACGMSYRQLTRELDLSTNTLFTRMRAGKEVHSDSLATVLHWMRMDDGIRHLIVPTDPGRGHR